MDDNQIVQRDIAADMEEKLSLSLEKNLLYFVFTLISKSYNEETGEKNGLQKIFLKFWSELANKSIILPDVKEVNKELSNPLYSFDSLINQTDSLTTESFHALFNSKLRGVKENFLQLTDTDQFDDEKE